ncbi:MAG: Gfo/Idh/MocA family oxidoreductase [Chloroflexi bacterium]|nr:Gfo/Idh/MocA family oxidoreductase [Chloroflexota bacterium]
MDRQAPDQDPRSGLTSGAHRRALILCEKPIADSWENSLAVHRLARRAGIKLAVVQNYRHTARIRTLKRVLDEERLGRINTISCHFAADYTIDTAGGAFRHRIPDAMIYEGAEHHLDMFRHLAGADAAWVAGTQWNPTWSTFDGNCCAMFIIEMLNGVVCHYEMTHIARGHENPWHHELYRVECERGGLSVDADDVVRIIERRPGGGDRLTGVEAEDRQPVDHAAVIEEFLDWLDGGREPLSSADDNIRTAALTFAAVEAANTRRVVDVVAKTEEARHG